MARDLMAPPPERASVDDPRHTRCSKDEPKPLTLNPWWSETQLAHRALLLLAIQDPGNNTFGRSLADNRNVVPIVRALDGYTTENTVRSWVRRNNWADRVAVHGQDAQGYAIRLYRRLYLLEWGRHDMEHLAELISMPVVAPVEGRTELQAEIADELQDLGVDAVVQPEPDPEPVEPPVDVGPVVLPSEAKEAQARETAAREEWEKRRELARNHNRSLGMTVQALVRLIQQGARAALEPAWARANPHVKPLQAKVSDLDKLYALQQRLQDEEARLSGAQVITGGGRVQDTARVAVAKELGQPLLAAVRADLLDALLLVDQLQQQPIDLTELQLQQAVAEPKDEAQGL